MKMSRLSSARQRVSTIVMAAALTPLSVRGQVDPLGPLGAPRLNLVEVTRVGGLDERREYALAQVWGATVLSDGRIAVSDGLSREVRLFDRSGTFLRAIGREGDGPGEFRALREVAALPGDRILAWDIQRGNASIFTDDGELLSTALIDADLLGSMILSFVGATSDGGVVLRSNTNIFAMRSEPEGMRRDSVSFGFFDPTGRMLGAPVRVEGPERLFYRRDGSWGTERLIFGRELLSGNLNDELLVVHSDSVLMRRLSPSGRAVPLKLDRPPRPATRADVREERSARMREVEERGSRPVDRDSRFPGMDQKRARAELERLRELEAHATWPALGDLKVGADGRIWVQDYPDPRSAVVRWFAMSAGFSPIGWVELPRTQRILAIRGSTLVTLARDEWDAESVVVYAIEGMPPGGDSARH